MRPHLQHRMATAALLYLPFYAFASYLELGTTRLAVTTSGTREGNAFVTSHGRVADCGKDHHGLALARC